MLFTDRPMGTMLIMRRTVAAVVIFIQAFQCLASDDSTFNLKTKLGLCLTSSRYSSELCYDVRWTTNNRLLVPSTNKCLGAQGKTLGSAVSLYDCDENSDLQKWECNGTLLALQNTDLYINVTRNGAGVLTKVTGPNSHFIINGLQGPCSRTYRELFTIEGNAFGRPCMFPFFYKDQWYSECTVTDSPTKRKWCAVETKFEHELWGYCPSMSTDNWKKHPVTGVSYQVNRQSALSWFQAQTSCKQQGASLLSITDPHEQAYVTALLGSENYILWTGLNLNPDHGWGWADGKPFRYLQWDTENPLPDPGHSCAVIDSGAQSNWKSEVCSKKLGYICQKGGSLPRPTEVETGHCSRPWIPYNGECFHLHRENKSWVGAKIECRKEGGDLASVHNIEDHSFIISQLGYASSDELWIGLNDKKTERLFDWTDHSTVTYTSWQFGEPSTSGDTEDCVLMRGEKGNWADRSCEEKHGFICSKPSATNPTEDEVEQNVGCKPGWKRHGYYCYLVGSVTKTFDEAKAECKSSGSYLVDVSNGVDNAFLISLVGMRPEKYFWLGLSNQRNIDSFEWSNGASVRFTHWNALMPGHQQGCVAILTGIFSGLWDVLPCTNKEKYICKHLAEGGVITPPPPTPLPPPNCPEGWTRMATRSFCYKLFTGPRSGEKTWYESRDYCRGIGGDLLSLHSRTDIVGHRFLTAWIGLSAPDQTTGFVWTDGSPVNFLHWMSGRPSYPMSSQSCVEMRLSQWGEEGSWRNEQCQAYNDWLCQIRLGVTPKPPPSNPANDFNTTADGWLVWQGNQYKIMRVPVAMESARRYCQVKHSDLVIINSEAENAFLWKQITKQQRYSSGSGSYYIGMKVDLDGSYEWLDESPAVFTKWGENQPDFRNSDENCVAIDYNNGLWHDYNCGFEHGFICKRSASPPVNATVPPKVVPKGGCPPEWIRFPTGSKCYRIVTDRKETWTAARAQCRRKNGNLVSIMSRYEQVFLASQMAETAAASDLWTGLNSLRGDGFYWTDGRQKRYINMHPTFRNMGQCVLVSTELANKEFGTWKRKSCNDTNGYVCKKDVDERFSVDAEPMTPDHYVQLGNDSIKILTQNVTWDQAKKLCEAEGAQLASIRNDWSQAYVELQAMNLKTPLWIGLNTKETGGYFRFIDGWRLTTSYWARNEPSRDQPCVYVDVDGKWKTAPSCNQTINSVCMKSTEVPPTVSTEQSLGVCPDAVTMPYSGDIYWMPFRDSCYLFVTHETEWAKASSICKTRGGELATIGDPAEQTFIQSTVEMLKDSHRGFWMGLYKTNRGKWLWLDETPVDYENWAPSMPDFDHFGEIRSSDGMWRSLDGKWDRAYICEAPKEMPEQLPTAAAIDKPFAITRHGARSALVVVLVFTVLAVLAVTAFILYKKSGRPMPTFDKLRTFDNPMYFNRERSQPGEVDTSKLIENLEKAEGENPVPIITF